MKSFSHLVLSPSPPDRGRTQAMRYTAAQRFTPSAPLEEGWGEEANVTDTFNRTQVQAGLLYFDIAQFIFSHFKVTKSGETKKTFDPNGARKRSTKLTLQLHIPG